MSLLKVSALSLFVCGSVLASCKTRQHNEQNAADAKFLSVGGAVNEMYRVVGLSRIQKNGVVQCNDSGIEIANMDANPDVKQNELRFKCLSNDLTVIHNLKGGEFDTVLLYAPDSTAAVSEISPERDAWANIQKGDCVITNGFRESGFGKKPIRANTIKVIPCPSPEALKANREGLKFPQISGVSFYETFEMVDLKFKTDQNNNIICREVEIIGRAAGKKDKSFRLHCDRSATSTLVHVEDRATMPVTFNPLQYYKNESSFAHRLADNMLPNQHSAFNRKYNSANSITEFLAKSGKGCQLEVLGRVAEHVVTANSIVVKNCPRPQL